MVLRLVNSGFLDCTVETLHQISRLPSSTQHNAAIIPGSRQALTLQCGQKFTRGDLGDPEDRDQIPGRERELSIQGRKQLESEGGSTCLSHG